MRHSSPKRHDIRAQAAGIVCDVRWWPVRKLTTVNQWRRAKTEARQIRVGAWAPPNMGCAMVFKYLTAGIVFAMPVVATAQAGPTQDKSPAQITCELTGDCDAFNQELADRDAGPDRSLRFDVPQRGAKTLPPAPGYAAPTKRVSSLSAQRAPLARPAAKPYVKGPTGRTSLSINFASGSATIAPGSQRQAMWLAESLKQGAAASKRYIVGGHTDSVGNREYNLDLSRRRAEALVDFLVQNGVERSRLQPEGYGFDKPLPGLGAKSPANRRVEIVKID